ncbi:MAG: RNA-binding protein [bacterium]
MSKKLYVGGLPYSTTTEELEAAFAPFGTVEEAIIISDRETGRSKGFGFVTITEDKGADDAIEAMNGKDFNGRPLTVNEARPKEAAPAYRSER